jgi:anti-anti-sigma factor
MRQTSLKPTRETACDPEVSGSACGVAPVPGTSAYPDIRNSGKIDTIGRESRFHAFRQFEAEGIVSAGLDRVVAPLPLKLFLRTHPEEAALDPAKVFELELRHDYAVLSVSSRLGAFELEEMQDVLGDVVARLDGARCTSVIIDLSAFDFLGSAQLTMLVRIWKSIKDKSGRMVVQTSVPVIKEVLHTAGLDTLWQIVDTRHAAYKSLGLQRDGRPPISFVWPAIGLAALVSSALALAISVRWSGSIDARAIWTTQVACAAVALTAGVWIIIRGSGLSRGLGIGMAAAGMLLAAVEVLRLQ